jgi:hypothetical protein
MNVIESRLCRSRVIPEMKKAAKPPSSFKIKNAGFALPGAEL